MASKFSDNFLGSLLGQGGRVARGWGDRLANRTLAFLVKRLAQALLTLLIASFLCFIIIQLAPGDYLDTLRGNPLIPPEYIDEQNRQFGLDRPWLVQYFLWLGNLLGFRLVPASDGAEAPAQLTWAFSQIGNLGKSFVYQRPVASLLGERVPATLLLAFASLLVTWVIALPMGIVAAVHQNRWSDRLLRVLSYLGQGFPSFITALGLLIVAQRLSPLLPVGDMTSIYHADLSGPGRVLDIAWHMLLPTIALSVASFAGLQRITRGEMLEVLRQDYIRTARAKGLPENRVLYGHALRNAINPLITLLGFEFASLLSGAFIAEYFFNWPGLGRLILRAVFSQDLYLVMASLMMGAVMLIVGNLLADILLAIADPRIQLGAED